MRLGCIMSHAWGRGELVGRGCVGILNFYIRDLNIFDFIGQEKFTFMRSSIPLAWKNMKVPLVDVI